jgi:class 3 adenylate cyclase
MALGGVPAPQGLRKVVTIVFSDLCDSTQLGERLDPEALRQVIARYFEEMSAALTRHGGAIEKFIGDAVMAVFGTPSVREDDALRAVRGAADMRTALAELNEQLEERWGVRLQARTGVNTGEVIAGDPSRGEGFVSGDAVNVAARLEQAAPPDEILIGEHTLKLVRDAVQVEPVPPLELKGKSDRVPAYRLLDIADRAVGPSLRLSSPLIGRETELALLRGAFDRAVAGRTCELVTIAGSAGVGKSRLANDFADLVRGAARVAAGRCLSYGEGLTFWPLREVVETLAETESRDSSEEARERIARLLPADDDTDTIVERVAGALGLSDSEADRTETFWAVRKLVEAAAAERPLVLLFEDVHWAEPTFLDLIEYLASTIQGLPVLILVVARPELLDTRTDLAAATWIDLAPLSPAESRALVDHLLGDGEMAAGLSERVSSGAQGNPLFVEELVRLLVDEGIREPTDLSVPPTVHALLAARLDRLDRTERGVIEAASVVGMSFGGGAILELGGASDRDELDRQLEALVRKQLVEPDGGRSAGEETFSFTHILLRDVAYEGMLKMLRADLHARYADWVEREAGERAGEFDEILGYHLERSYRYHSELGALDERGRQLRARAAARLGSSGGRALARGDIRPAASLLERAVSLLDDDDPARRELSVKLGIALAETGQLSRAGELLYDRIEAERRGNSFVVFHDRSGKEHVVSLDNAGATLSVGRRDDNDIALSWDEEVSRRHAQLQRVPEGWVVLDDGSRNGSYLNGQLATGPQLLRDGDVLRFGDTVVLFRAPVGSGGQRSEISLAPDQATRLPRPSEE